MALVLGGTLPAAKLKRMTENGIEDVNLHDLTSGKRVVIFAVPGAFTSTCHKAHVPSFIRAKDDLMAKGIEAIICVTVNDPFVTKSWEEATGADQAGLITLADTDSSFSKAMGMTFSAPPVGLFDRSQRYAIVVNDNVIQSAHEEPAPGEFGATSGESVLAAL